MIKLPNGFNITTPEAIDSRLVMTQAQMLAAKKGRMPDKYICICKDNSRVYIYDSTMEPDPNFGYFKPYEKTIDIPVAINASMAASAAKKSETEIAVGTTLPGAVVEALSTTEKRQVFTQALSGAFNADHFTRDTDNKIDLNIQIIQAVDDME